MAKGLVLPGNGKGEIFWGNPRIIIADANGDSLFPCFRGKPDTAPRRRIPGGVVDQIFQRPDDSKPFVQGNQEGSGQIQGFYYPVLEAFRIRGTTPGNGIIPMNRF